MSCSFIVGIAIHSPRECGPRAGRTARRVRLWKSEILLDGLVDVGYVRLVVLRCRQLAASAAGVVRLGKRLFVLALGAAGACS